MSKHALITFSGFLSQQDTSIGSWGSINEILEPRGINCFDLKWQSISYTELAKKLALCLGKLAVEEISSFILAPGGPSLKILKRI